MKIYYDGDANLEDLEKETVAVIGYGIQGRAQSLNLRDSKINVVVSNREDSYYEQAVKDGFKVYSIDEAVNQASIVMMLIPDQAQGEVFDEYIKPNLKEGSMLVVAHGYSIRFNKVICPSTIDVTLLAPRFPGDVLRNNYLKNKGTLAFFDEYHDFTGNAKKRGLALAKAIGFTKAGLIEVSLKEETEIDLFIEQFLIPSFLKTIQTGFDVLVENGYTPEIALMELFTSGEIMGLLSEGTKVGMYQSFQNNTSPTCQFGVKESFDRIITEKSKETAKKVLSEIVSGDFSRRLEEEAKSGYSKLKDFNKKNNESKLIKTQEELLRMIGDKEV
jgi:ketol-acid reductoisomerase